MSPRIFLFITCCLFAPRLHAAAADPSLMRGLEAFVSNGVEAGIRSWYADRPELAGEVKDEILPATKNLGEIIDTEVVAVQQVSKRVVRYYVAIYFARRPLWIRLERYENRDKAFYLPLRFSTNPDEILPGYVTEFRQ